MRMAGAGQDRPVGGPVPDQVVDSPESEVGTTDRSAQPGMITIRPNSGDLQRPCLKYRRYEFLGVAVRTWLGGADCRNLYRP